MLKFQTLAVWQKAMDLADIFCEIADGLPVKYQYSFAEQLRRAALSVPSNIAEGNGRSTKKDAGHFYVIARGSVYECINILVLLSRRKIDLGDAKKKKLIYDLAEEVSKMLTVLAK